MDMTRLIHRCGHAQSVVADDLTTASETAVALPVQLLSSLRPCRRVRLSWHRWRRSEQPSRLTPWNTSQSSASDSEQTTADVCEHVAAVAATQGRAAHCAGCRRRSRTCYRSCKGRASSDADAAVSVTESVTAGAVPVLRRPALARSISGTARGTGWDAFRASQQPLATAAGIEPTPNDASSAIAVAQSVVHIGTTATADGACIPSGAAAEEEAVATALIFSRVAALAEVFEPLPSFSGRHLRAVSSRRRGHRLGRIRLRNTT